MGSAAEGLYVVSRIRCPLQATVVKFVRLTLSCDLTARIRGVGGARIMRARRFMLVRRPIRIPWQLRLAVNLVVIVCVED